MEEDKTKEKDERPEMFSREWMMWFVLSVFLLFVVFSTSYDLQDNTLDNQYLLIAAYVALAFIIAYALIKNKKKQGVAADD